MPALPAPLLARLRRSVERDPTSESLRQAPDAAPVPEEGRRIVIVGGGFVGTALAVRLLGTGDPSLRITLVEPGPRLGRGVAYGTEEAEHRLNVPAGSMSLHPDRPDDFLAFARERVGEVAPDALLPRALYGAYVQDRLERAIAASPARLRLARTTAEAVRRPAGGWAVDLADGRILAADEVVLATGHGPPRAPAPFEALGGHPAIVADPWAPGALDALAGAERVLLVGTGLTAVDVAVSLRKRGWAGPLVAVSRNGRWPRPHLPQVRWTGERVVLSADAAPRTADGLAGWLGEQVRAARAEGRPWQAVLEAVRPLVPALWARLPEDERARFLRDHRPRWEVLRHRLERTTWEALRAWSRDGWLVTRAGGVAAVAPAGDGVAVTFTGGTGEAARFDRVVLCCGQESDPRRFTAPLWRRLIADGLVTADPHGLGVRTDTRGAILGTRGPTEGLWALGGLLRPLWFESTAVPELARQAAALADVLVSSIGAYSATTTSIR